VTQAQGTVGASQSSIVQSQQAVGEAQAAVSQAKHMLEQQQANLQKAQSDYARYKGADPDAISGQQLEAALTNYKAAEAARNSAQAALGQTQARLAQAQANVKSSVSKLTQSKGVAQAAQAQTLQLDVVKSQYEGSLASVKMAEDQVRQAKLNLSYTRILAPVSGRVGKKTVEVGQRVQPGEQLMAVVSSDIWVVANYKETQLSRMRPGQSVEVEVDAFPSRHFEGVVNSFSPASGAQFALLPPENATGNFTKIVQRIPVKILLKADSLKGYEDLLVPGMSTVVSVKVSETPDKRKSE
jgi:membrane fusion protein (multidrug efflux system)